MILSYLILGLLRDGEQQHGYHIVTWYRARTGRRANPGPFYRELGRLAAAGLVCTGVNPPGADARRVPYRITPRGCAQFDRWLGAPAGADLDTWVFFAERLSPDARGRTIERLRNGLLLRRTALGDAREEACVRQRAAGRYEPLPALLAREMKVLSAELDFLDEVRARLAAREAPASAGMPVRCPPDRHPVGAGGLGERSSAPQPRWHDGA